MIFLSDMPVRTPQTMLTRIVVSLACVLLVAGCGKQSDKSFDKELREYLLAHPEVIQEAAIKLKQKQAAAAAGVMKNAQERLERDPRDFVANPNGAITVVQFFDYRCTYCQAVAPEVLKLIANTPDVRVVFKEHPVFGSVSDSAARVALTPQGKSKGLELYQALMGQRKLTEARLDTVIRSVGLNPQEVRAAARDPAITQQILDTRTLAQEINITGTPTFLVAGQVIQGADMDKLDAAIKRARSVPYEPLASTPLHR